MVQCESAATAIMLDRVANNSGAVGAGFVPAAFGPIAKEFKVTPQKASYLTTFYTLLGGLTPLIITPFANLYGRRPAYIVSQD
jgi:hypothetical protein